MERKEYSMKAKQAWKGMLSGLLIALLALLLMGMALAEQPDNDPTHLDLRKLTFKNAEEILALLAENPGVESVVFGKKAIPAATLDAIWAAYPDIQLEYGFLVGKKTIRSTDESAVVGSKLEVDQFIEALRYLPKLKEFEAYNANFTYEHMETLTQRYPDLTLRCTLSFAEHRLKNTATAFSTLHSTKSDRHTQEDLKVLKYAKNLVALDLGHNAITDISFLDMLPGLKVLILADNQISDLEPIRSQTQLEYLELFRNPIENVEPISGLPNLLDLNISYCNITDGTPLATLTSLERLWISQHTFFLPEEQQEMLQEAIPGCRFNFTCITGSSGGGWRKPYTHYGTVKKIFDSRTYRPFPKK